MKPEPQEEKDYWSLLQSSQRPFYPNFVDHLSSQEGGLAEHGRAAVIEFQDGGKPLCHRFQSSRTLRKYINNSASSGVGAHGRAFVLEGLPANFVKVIGARLRVPPSFFAAHWPDPGAYVGNLMNRTPRHDDCQDRCVLSFRRLHQARIVETDENPKPDGDYYMESSVYHTLSRTTVFGDDDGPLSSSEQLSFWCMREAKPWIALLLVDPPLGKSVKLKGSTIPRDVIPDDSIPPAPGIEDHLSQKGSWYPPCSQGNALPSTLAEWEGCVQTPRMMSFFDDILLLYPLTKHSSVAHPKDYMDICRNIVLIAWTAWTRTIEAQIIQEQVKLYRGTEVTDPSSAASMLDTSWTTPWDQRQFNRLMRAKTKLEALDADLSRNMDSLGILGDATTRAVHPWEADAWSTLHRALGILKARLEIMSQAYTQAVSARESITSNEQARQVGLLTSLATMFIPISFVAAVFSMGGAFAAGERLFWVYWVIAVPIVVFGCGLLFTRLGRLLWKRVSRPSRGIEKSLV